MQGEGKWILSFVCHDRHNHQGTNNSIQGEILHIQTASRGQYIDHECLLKKENKFKL